jgi:hypothetical protein
MVLFLLAECRCGNAEDRSDLFLSEPELCVVLDPIYD